MLALGIGQHHGARDAVEHVGRRRAAPPCSSQVYQVALTLARCATSSRRRPGRSPPRQLKAERGGIELRAAVPQIGAERMRSTAEAVILLVIIPV